MKANDIFLRNTMYRFMLPTILSVLGGTVNVMVDGIIIGNAIGAEALAAINLCFPIYLVLCTFGSLFASGACTLSSIAIGEKDSEKSSVFYSLAFYILLFLGLAITLAGVLFSKDYVLACGIPKESVDMVYIYIKIMLLGGLPQMMLYLPFYYLRFDGRPKLVTVTLLILTLTNLGLDLLFVVVFSLGMFGAALASAVSTAIALAFGICFLFGKNSSVKLKWPKFSVKNLICIIKYGSPRAMDNFLTALNITFLNIIILKAGGSTALSVLAVICCIGEFSLCLISGIPQTTASIIGVYKGEQDNSSIRIIMKRQFFIGSLLIGIFSLILIIFWRPICGIFGLNEILYSGTKFAVLCLAVGMLFKMQNSILSFYFGTVGRIALSNMVIFLQMFALPLIAGVLLLYCSNEFAVWLLIPTSELGTLVIILFVTYLVSMKNKALSKLLLLDDTLEREGKIISFSVSNDIENVMDASVKIGEFCESNEFSPKQQMTVSLAIEEMLTLTLQRCFEESERTQSIDVRIYTLNDTIGIRLRCGGRQFNAVDYYENNKEDEFGESLGIKMIVGMAKEVSYLRTFGVNSLNITL